MLRPKHAAVILLVLVVLGGGWVLFGNGYHAEAPAPEESEEVAVAEGYAVFEDPANSIGFQYPELYLLVERDVEDADGTHRQIMLIEDTEEHRALINGEITEAREGPPAITIDLFQNEAGHTISEWIASSSEGYFPLLEDQFMSVLDVDGRPAHFYRFSGLYEGYALIVAGESRIYAFAVTFLSHEDRIIDDYNDLLESAVFSL